MCSLCVTTTSQDLVQKTCVIWDSWDLNVLDEKPWNHRTRDSRPVYSMRTLDSGAAGSREAPQEFPYERPALLAGAPDRHDLSFR